MKVTLTTILSDEKYPAVGGTEYEVAPGVFVKLKNPTIDLRDQFLPALQEATDAQMEYEKPNRNAVGRLKPEAIPDWIKTIGDAAIPLAKMVTEGTWPEEGKVLPKVPSRIVQDFTVAVSPT